MAVIDRVWRSWRGPSTPVQGRLTVLARFALADAFASRAFLAFYVVCLLPSIAGLLAVFFSHNTVILEQAPGIHDWLQKVPEWIFLHLFAWQAIPAFFAAVIVAPSLICVDMSHNALALILSRPIRRREYVAGKLAVLVVLLSPLTWIPALGVFGLQSALAGSTWFFANLRIGFAYVVGHWTWMIVVSLLGLAISATVRHAALARGALLAIFFIAVVSGGIINQLTRTSIGDLLNLPRAVTSVVFHLFGAPTPSGLPVVLNWTTLVLISALSLWLLSHRLKAFRDVA